MLVAAIQPLLRLSRGSFALKRLLEPAQTVTYCGAPSSAAVRRAVHFASQGPRQTHKHRRINVHRPSHCLLVGLAMSETAVEDRN